MLSQRKNLTLPCLWGVMLIAVFCCPTPATAQAFCALRDPVRTIYEMFPNASSYRSLVRTVDSDARDAVGVELDIQLHHAELGQHTMYVPFDDDTPLGLVQVRAERSRWGLVEIVWALGLDLTVHDLRFQRCRSPSRAVITETAFRSALIGKDIRQLEAMLSTDRSRLNLLDIAPEDEPLAVTIVTSGLKTLATSTAVWQEDIALLRELAGVAP